MRETDRGITAAAPVDSGSNGRLYRENGDYRTEYSHVVSG